LKIFFIKALLKIELALRNNKLEEDALSDTDGPEMNSLDETELRRRRRRRYE